MHLCRLCGVWFAVCTMAAAALAAETYPSYPSRPLRFIVPFPPGGANDTVARLAGPKITERLGQQVVVDNRLGASGAVALDLTARATPDGYTLLVGNNTSNGIVPVLFAARMKSDPRKELTGITLMAEIQHVLIASVKLPPNTFQELIEYVRARPGRLNYSAPLGGHPHLDMLALAAATKLNMVHVPSKGAGESIPMLLRGEAQVSNSNLASVIGLLRAGQLKAYAVTGAQRIGELPTVPTFTEMGVGEVGSVNWVGLFAPARTPRAIIDKLHAVIADILSKPDMKETYAARLVPLAVSRSPAEFNAFVLSEIRRWEKVVKDNKLSIE